MFSSINFRNMETNFNQAPIQIVQSTNREIHIFETDLKDQNIDHGVVRSFGEEWKTFNDFQEDEIEKIGNMYFDIVGTDVVNKNTYAIDIGCGTGRWSKYLLNRIGFMEAVDPSDAIFVADKLLGKKKNVRLSKASIDNIPFENQTFDFAMSIGVLHHVPDTLKAMKTCVGKIKLGGYFYVYLYYNLENKNHLIKTIFFIVSLARKTISKLPFFLRKIVCDIIAVTIYLPLITLGRLLKFIGLKQLAKNLPLSFYQNQSFLVIRNDALDRFGTSIEQRFSKTQIIEMMETCGLDEIIVSENLPYWHALGKRVK